ncbi:hypothetical protein ACHQM5_008754 [Ranunculus cassubicifolius]
MVFGAAGSTSNTDSTGSWRWNSPVPYLYGGIVVVLGVIAMAIITLACSHWKSPDDNSSPYDEVENSVRRSLPQLDFEPKIVVIMAGNDEATYLATPVASVIKTRA